MRQAVSTRTKYFRERAGGTLDELYTRCEGEIERHVARSRRLFWLGYPAYIEGDWFRSMRAPNPKRLDVRINAIGFPVFEKLARAHPNWIDHARRSVSRTPVDWPAVLHSGARAVPCAIIDVSPTGVQARISGSTCADCGIRPGSPASIELNGVALPLHVAWHRTASFGGRFRPLPAGGSP